MKKITLITVFAWLCMSLVAQNVAITDDNSYSPDSSAMLDVKSLNKGLLVPRLTTAQRALIASPAVGLLVFDTDLKSFYLYNGTAWTNLTSGSPNALWSISGDQVYLTDTENNLGIGTANPWGRLEVKGSATESINTPIFHVTNSSGDTVFAVYPSGVRINVADDPAAKALGSKGGFAVGGFSSVKGPTNDYLWVTPDSVRVYIEEGSSKALGSKGGFAVGGFSSVKSAAPPIDYFNILGSGTANTLNPSQARIFWYPLKEALIAGRVLVESPDSVGTNSFASGYESKAIGNYSQALGYKARAVANYSTAIGNYANAEGQNSFALGDSVLAKGLSSFALGSVRRDALGVAVGEPTKATGDYSVSVGLGALASASGAFSGGTNTVASGQNSIAMGNGTIASNNYAVALGYNTTASGVSSIAVSDGSTASGSTSIAMGKDATASAYKSTAIGWNALAYGDQGVAIGPQTSANFFCSALGYGANATGSYATALGPSCQASGDFGSTSLGFGADASGSYGALALGYNTTASGDNSIAIGSGIEAQGIYSIAIGLNNQSGTILTDANSMAIMGGEVGIGTISPEAPLDVETDASGFAIHIEENGAGIEEWQIGVDINGDLNFFDGSTQLITFEDLGNVGIGVLNPVYKLDVGGLANLNSGIASGTALRVNGDEALWYNGTYFSWGFGGTANYFSDYVGIGTTTPNYALDLTTDADGGYAARFINTGNTATRYGLKVQAGMYDATGTNYMIRCFDGDGGFEGGLAVVNGTLQINQNSDRRLKENIKKTEIDALRIIKNLEVVDFNFIANQKIKHTGYIAQDAQKVFPEFTTYDKETDTYGITMTALIPVLHKAMQEQQQTIEKLIIENKKQQEVINSQEEAIRKLNTQNDSMKADISEIKAVLNSSAGK